MKRNRKKTKHTVVKAGFMGIAVLIVTGFIMLMAYWSLDSRCASILREIGKAEKRYQALEAECGQEATRWAEMKTREKLDLKLTRFCVEMNYPHQSQIVRMDAQGRPARKPGEREQMSVVRARERLQTGAMAMNGGKNGRARASLPNVTRTVTARH